MEDQSIFNQTNENLNNSKFSGQNNSADNEYINMCIKEVCINGDSLSKYQKIIEKKFSPNYYQKCNDFVEEIKHSLSRKKFTNTSIINLKYLANNIQVSEETVNTVIQHFSNQFTEEEREKAEKEKIKIEEEQKRQALIAEQERIKAEQEEKELKKQETIQKVKHVFQIIWKILKVIFIIVKWILGLFVCALLGILLIISLFAPSIREGVLDRLEETWELLKRNNKI